MKKIAVLSGGLSPERDVSLTSGSLISNTLIENGNAVAFLDVYKDVATDGGKSYADLFTTEKYEIRKISENAPSLAEVAEARHKERIARRGYDGNSDALIGDGVIEVCGMSDVVFIALHGAMGENGQLQALLDCHGINYTGSGYDGCLISMDKEIAKIIARSNGIDTADWIAVDSSNVNAKADIIEKIGLPCVVKPLACGSSVGVSIVKEEASLDSALAFAAEYEGRILVEKMIKGRELSVGVLRGEALPSIEIIPKSGFYDYKNKYQSGMTEEITPADIPADIEKKLGTAAVAAHKALRLGTYSRSDFIYVPETGRIVWLEVNTLPGMTPMSLLPQEARAKGISYSELCSIIADNPAKK